MIITGYQAILAATLCSTTCSAPKGSPLESTGRSILRMAAAYESDGGAFLSAGDLVNALAAFLYGLGWLHCGLAAGVLVSQESRSRCPFTGITEPVPVSQQEKLEEKTGRYSLLLTTALASVSPAPEPGTPPHTFALQVLFIAGLYLRQGNCRAQQRQEEGLACFSYGHGWLDAGVQAGLFSIQANREIFTVD